jgi:predicted aspartyl protease
LIQFNLEKIEQIWVATNDRDSIVIVGSLNDPIINGLVSDRHAEYARNLRQEINQQQMQPTAFFSMRRWDAYKLFTKIQKRLHQTDPRDPKVSRIVEMLAKPAADGHFWVMAISNGKQIAPLPCPAK